MKRFAPWLGAAAATIVLVLVVAAAALPWVVDRPAVQALITASVAQTLGRPVTVQSLSARVFPRPGVELRGLEIADDPRFGPAPFMTLERGELRLRLGALVSGRIEFGDLVLKRPLVTLIQDAGGRWNFASLGTAVDARHRPARPRAGGGAAGAGAVLASRVRLEHGTVGYVSTARGGGLEYRLADVELTITPARPGLTLTGSARLVPGDLMLKLTEGVISPAGGRPLTEAALRGRLAIDGKELAAVVERVVGREPAVDGGLRASFVLGGTLGEPSASGDVSLPRLRVTRTNAQCAEPRRRSVALDRVTLNAAWVERQLLARPVRAGLAGGEIATNLVATVEGAPHVELKDLAVKGVAIEKLLVDFLCQGYAVTGPLDLTGTVGFDPRDALSTLAGSGEFRIGEGRVVGAQARHLLGDVGRASSARSALFGSDVPAGLTSPLEFQAITATFQAANGIVTTRDLRYTSRGLRMAVAGRYALASGRLDLDVTLDHGRGHVQAKVTGSAAAPSIRLLPDAVFRSTDPAAVESGLRDLLRRFR